MTSTIRAAAIPPATSPRTVLSSGPHVEMCIIIHHHDCVWYQLTFCSVTQLPSEPMITSASELVFSIKAPTISTAVHTSTVVEGLTVVTSETGLTITYVRVNTI